MSKQAQRKLSEKYQPGSMPEIFRLVEQVSRKLKRFQQRTIREANLTPAQYALLSLLWEKDGTPFKDLASASFCSPAAITGLVDTLEKKGLVTREANPGDRRSLLVRLTEPGKSLRHSTPTLERIYRTCCVGLPEEELRQLDGLLRKLNDSLPF
ncbi:MAG: MarR family transcriptional regulator [Chloroflexi bacterium]|nr:MarR family transcriptional regulator [Chloroflexota bacterium]